MRNSPSPWANWHWDSDMKSTHSGREIIGVLSSYMARNFLALFVMWVRIPLEHKITALVSFNPYLSANSK